MYERAIYKYYIYADVNNLGRICIFETENWLEARSYMRDLHDDSDLNGYYHYPKMQRKLEAFEVHE